MVVGLERGRAGEELESCISARLSEKPERQHALPLVQHESLFAHHGSLDARVSAEGTVLQFYHVWIWQVCDAQNGVLTGCSRRGGFCLSIISQSWPHIWASHIYQSRPGDVPCLETTRAVLGGGSGLLQEDFELTAMTIDGVDSCCMND